MGAARGRGALDWPHDANYVPALAGGSEGPMPDPKTQPDDRSEALDAPWGAMDAPWEPLGDAPVAGTAARSHPTAADLPDPDALPSLGDLDEVEGAAPTAAQETEPLPAAPEPEPAHGATQPAPASPEAAPAPQPKPKPAPTLDPEADVAALDELEAHLYAHRYATVGMDVFGSSIDPEAAADDRAEAMATLEREANDLLCSPETGDLLGRLSQEGPALDDTRRAQVRVLARDRNRIMNVPAGVQADYRRLLSRSTVVWHKAKLASDWASFSPYLDQTVEAMRRIAQMRNPEADSYDVWLDEFEPGTSRAFYDDFFDQVRGIVVPLFEAVRQSGRQPSRRAFEGRYGEQRQWELARDLMRLEGLPMDSVLLTHTEHPYSDALSPHYGVIATHVHEDDVLSNVYSMLHEGGHVLYELGCDPAYARTSLRGGTSMGMHEGQSRFFENYVGRSRAFAPHVLKVMAAHFPGQLGRVTPNQFYLAANRAEGSLVRTEADELTYPLHVMIRYEIEQALFDGELAAKDVPAVWNQRYRDYLGVTVPDDRHGALQDSHWSTGLLGYFPTYALGGAYGAQLRHQMIADGVDWEGTLAAGDLSPIHSWLHRNVWRWGRAKDPQDIIRDSCHEAFTPRYYLDYLVDKFAAIYSLG